MNAFHEHLDVCQRCANQPFSLCAVGERLLRESVELLARRLAPIPKGGRA